MSEESNKMSLSEYEENILNNVDEHGFFVNSVFDPNGVDPDFSYSIGFPSSLNCPDFIIFGLPKDLMHNMLWDVFHQIKEGKLPEDGTEWLKLLDGDYVCVSKRVHPSNHIREYLNSSMWYYKHLGRRIEDFSAFQLVWPGTRVKKLPWEDGCAVDVIEAQTPLWLKRSEQIEQP